MVLAVQAHNELLGYFFYSISETEYMSVQPEDVSKMIKTPDSKEKKGGGLALREIEEGMGTPFSHHTTGTQHICMAPLQPLHPCPASCHLPLSASHQVTEGQR